MKSSTGKLPSACRGPSTPVDDRLKKSAAVAPTGQVPRVELIVDQRLVGVDQIRAVAVAMLFRKK